MSKKLGVATACLIAALLAGSLAAVALRPVAGQGAGQTKTLDMIPAVAGTGASGSIAFSFPSGYEPSAVLAGESNWGAGDVAWQDYDNDGRRVVQKVTFPDGYSDQRTGDVLDGIGYGGGVLYMRGNADIRAEAEQNQKPYVKGQIIQEGAFTLPGPDGSCQGYYYLSFRTIHETGEWEWVYGYYNLALRIALTNVHPLCTVWVHFWTWGPVDFTGSEGTVYTFTLDGKPVMDAHRDYLDWILSSMRVETWNPPQAEEPKPSPASSPAGTPTPYVSPSPAGPTPSPLTSPAGTPAGYQTPSPGGTATPGQTGPYPTSRPPVIVSVPELPQLIVPVFSREDYDSGEMDETPDTARHLIWVRQSGAVGTANVERALEGENLYWYDRIRSDSWWVYYAMEYIEELERFLDARIALVAEYPELGEDLIPWIKRMIQDAVATLLMRADMLAESLAAAEAAGCHVSPRADDLVYDAEDFADTVLARRGIARPGSGSAEQAEPPSPQEMQAKSIELELGQLDGRIAEIEDRLAVQRQVAEWHLERGQALTSDCDALEVSIGGECVNLLQMAGGHIVSSLKKYLGISDEAPDQLQSAMQQAEGAVEDLDKGDLLGAGAKLADAAVNAYGDYASDFVKDFSSAFGWVGLGVDAGYVLSSMATYSELTNLLEAQVDGCSKLSDSTNQEIIALVNELNAVRDRRAELAQQVSQAGG